MPEDDIQSVVRNSLAIYFRQSRMFGLRFYSVLIDRFDRGYIGLWRWGLLYDYDCAGSKAYVALATEMIDREKSRPQAA